MTQTVPDRLFQTRIIVSSSKHAEAEEEYGTPAPRVEVRYAIDLNIVADVTEAFVFEGRPDFRTGEPGRTNAAIPDACIVETPTQRATVLAPFEEVFERWQEWRRYADRDPVRSLRN